MRTHSHSTRSSRVCRRRQRGVAIVEFALVAMLLFTLLIGIMDFGRWLYTLNAAAEATRLGARLAAVCSKSDQNNIKEKMIFFVGRVSSVSKEQISIHYRPNDTCDPDWTATSNVCESVTVQLIEGDAGAKFRTFIPFLAGSYAIPPFITTLPREHMNGTDNPVCRLTP